MRVITMRGNYATGVLVIMTAMLVTAVVASFVILKTATALSDRAVRATADLNCVLSAAESGQDLSHCVRDLNVPMDVNVVGG